MAHFDQDAGVKMDQVPSRCLETLSGPRFRCQRVRREIITAVVLYSDSFHGEEHAST